MWGLTRPFVLLYYHYISKIAKKSLILKKLRDVIINPPRFSFGKFGRVKILKPLIFGAGAVFLVLIPALVLGDSQSQNEEVYFSSQYSSPLSLFDVFINLSPKISIPEVNLEEVKTPEEIAEPLDFPIFQENTLTRFSNPLTILSSQNQRDEIIKYMVEEGDTPSEIAASFGITVNTLLWVNNLNQWSIIRPGQEIEILPLSGVKHKVKSGENVSSIAKKYKGETERIISFNDLPADGSIKGGDILIIPDGEMPRPKKIVVTYAAPSPKVSKGNLGSRRFPYGQCTWWVAQKRYVPWSGHAKHWLANAKAMGFSVCFGNKCQPVPGAIVSLYSPNSWAGRVFGHVAYVGKVTPTSISFSEMNHIGWARVSYRTIPRNSSLITGYIY